MSIFGVIMYTAAYARALEVRQRLAEQRRLAAQTAIRDLSAIAYVPATSVTVTKCAGCGSLEFKQHKSVSICSYCRVPKE